MRKLKLTPTCRARFLEALSETGSVTKAVAIAGTSRTRVYELRKIDPDFAVAWDEAEEIAADRLHEEATRRAVEGVLEPVVSAGKLVLDDDGQPVMVRRYSDQILLALLKAHGFPRRKRFKLPQLQSETDAPRAIASLIAAVADGQITMGEAVELSRLVEMFLKTKDEGERLHALLVYGVKW